jgi:prepilin-type N-terminal cleavage/methylation domain-containing protein
MKKLAQSRGFTLIELMVVIAIIGLLASTVMAALSNARVESRDTARLAQGRELVKALELYRTKNGDAYPCSSGASIDCTAGGLEASAYIVRPVGSSYINMEPNLRTALGFQPSFDSVGFALIYNLGSVSDPRFYNIAVGLEDPISSLTASTTEVTISGKTMYYCRISSGPVDTLSDTIATGILFKDVGRCPVNSIR